MAKCMHHWNGNQVCAIDTETTGLDPSRHEIWQISILPLDSNFRPRQDVMPFYIEMQIENPNGIDPDAIRMNREQLSRAMDLGHDPLKAIDMLREWITKLKLPVTRWGNPHKIIPLGHNFAFDRAFMQRWLTVDTYDEFFHYHYKDSMLTAQFMNDRAAMHGAKVPYSKVGLQWLATKLKIQTERAHDSLQDCIATAEVYRLLCSQGVWG